ncbi:glycosyltransferase [Krasilnikovia sp. MM14-A1259]|uniref:glycosyltransferase n=1 Tax=Krasilnikovia sp. MM14-A1259 TaxID=3373539 RepID=UPI00381A78D9
MSTERTVVIWRSALLSASETFVRDQADALARWRPRFLGATRVGSALARDTDVVAYPGGRRDSVAFARLRVTGRSPRLLALLRAARPDLVHAHFGGDGWLISRAAAHLRVPLVVTVHGHDVSRQPASAGIRGIRYRHNLRVVFDRAAVVLAVSGAIRDRAVTLGADPAKVRVHHTGVPVPAAVPCLPRRWDVAFVGRLIEKKGVTDLLTALATLRPHRPRVLIVGGGPLELQLRTDARRLGVEVTFAGVRTPAEVRDLLAQSRLLAAPSKTAPDGDSEGLPTTIVEASALGLPVVSTRHSGIGEAVVDGTTGLLGPEGDVPALAANLRRLLADEDLCRRLGRAGRDHVAARFDVRAQTRLLEDIYDDLVGLPRGGPGPPAGALRHRHLRRRAQTPES